MHTRAYLPQAALLAAVYRILRPLLRMCFRARVSIDQVRSAFEAATIAEAECHLREQTTKSTFSSVAALTGIPRRRVAELLAEDSPVDPRTMAVDLELAVQVLGGWREESGPITSSSIPAELPLHGPGSSLERLVRRLAPAMATQAVLDVLVRAGAVEALRGPGPDTCPHVRVKPTWSAADLDEAQRFVEFGARCGEAIELLEVQLAPTSDMEPVHQCKVTATVLAPTIRVLRRQLRERGEALHASVGELLSPHDLSPAEIAEVEEVDPDSLHHVQVTFISAIRRVNAAGTPHASRVQQDTPAPATEHDGG